MKRRNYVKKKETVAFGESLQRNKPETGRASMTFLSLKDRLTLQHGRKIEINQETVEQWLEAQLIAFGHMKRNEKITFSILPSVCVFYVGPDKEIPKEGEVFFKTNGSKAKKELQKGNGIREQTRSGRS